MGCYEEIGKRTVFYRTIDKNFSWTKSKIIFSQILPLERRFVCLIVR
jgi:hypothetical protein